MLPFLPKPIPFDPEILLLLAAIGAVIGAISTTASYMVFKIAEQEGRKANILPELLPFIKQEPQP